MDQKKQNKNINYDTLPYWNEYNYVSIVSNKTIWLNLIAYWYTFVIYKYSFQMDAVLVNLIMIKKAGLVCAIANQKYQKN